MKRILVLNLLIVLILANIVHEPALAGQEYTHVSTGHLSLQHLG